jgi:hypothetical protein
MKGVYEDHIYSIRESSIEKLFLIKFNLKNYTETIEEIDYQCSKNEIINSIFINEDILLFSKNKHKYYFIKVNLLTNGVKLFELGIFKI